MVENKKHEEIKQNITESEKHNATGAGSVTEGDKHLVETKTEKHLQDTDIISAIQFGNALMCAGGDDAEWPNAACESVRYASEEECMTEDDYNGMMAWLYDDADECRYESAYFWRPREWRRD